VNVRAIDGFMVKVSENPTETKDLLEGGFEHAYENTVGYSLANAGN
jgi:hypothetical protein